MTFVKTIEVSCFKEARVPDVFFFWWPRTFQAIASLWVQHLRQKEYGNQFSLPLFALKRKWKERDPWSHRQGVLIVLDGLLPDFRCSQLQPLGQQSQTEMLLIKKTAVFSKRTNLKLVASFCVVYNYCQLLFTFPAVDFCDFDLYRANWLLILLSFQSCAQHSYRFFVSFSSFVYLSFLVRFNFFVFFLVRFSFLLLLSHS